MDAPPDPNDKHAETSELWRLSGMGFEFAAAIASGGLIGWLVDKLAGTGQRWLLVGLVAGMIVGGFTFFRRAIALNRRAIEAYRTKRQRREGMSNGKGPTRRPAGGDWFSREQHDLDDEDDDESIKNPPDFDDW